MRQWYRDRSGPVASRQGSDCRATIGPVHRWGEMMADESQSIARVVATPANRARRDERNEAGSTQSRRTTDAFVARGIRDSSQGSAAKCTCSTITGLITQESVRP